MKSDPDDQQRVTRRYERRARFYDLFESPMDLMGGRRRRRRVISGARGRTLEVGIGTGRNLPDYPPGVDVVGIDVSPAMLARARRRAAAFGRDHGGGPVLDVADVAQLPFSDDTFDTVTATCVFCSVADPLQGLREVRRVVRPEGRVLLLEHVRPRSRLGGWLADRFNRVARALLGPNVNRRTEDTVSAAGLDIVTVRRHGVWREIVARPAAAGATEPAGDDRTAAPVGTGPPGDG